MAHVRLFTVDAVLVDCAMVRKRKAEVNLLSPADLLKILGPAALDESSAFVPLKELPILSTKLAPSTVENSRDAASTSRRPGGRRRLGLKEKIFFRIGRMIEDEFPRCERGFKLLRRLRNDGILDLETLRKELHKGEFSAAEIGALLAARTAMGATKVVVAKSRSTPTKPNGLSLRTVHSYYSRYLSAKLPSI